MPITARVLIPSAVAAALAIIGPHLPDHHRDPCAALSTDANQFACALEHDPRLHD